MEGGRAGPAPAAVEDVDMLIRPAMFMSELLFLEIMLRMVCSDRLLSSLCSSAFDFLAACEA